MEERVYIDFLNKDNVSIGRQKIFFDNGVEYPSAIVRKGYENSVEGRVKLQEEIPEPYLSAVMAVWGDKPTVSEE